MCSKEIVYKGTKKLLSPYLSEGSLFTPMY